MSDRKNNLEKAASFFRINGCIFLYSILMSWLAKPFLKNYPDVFDLLVGLPALALLLLAPAGLFYSWKSFRKKEGAAQVRFRYFMGNLFSVCSSF